MNRVLRAPVNYVAPMALRPRYYANDKSRDVVDLDPREVEITDARAEQPNLGVEGFTLATHRSALADFHDAEAVRAVYAPEIEALVRGLCGADEVRVTSPGVLRFGEKSSDSGRLNNSMPARFVHVDVDDGTAAAFADRAAPQGRAIRRFAHFNVWRVLTPPPQDVPLALCDASSVEPSDLVAADAVIDELGKPEWAFTGLLVRPNRRHRWRWFSDMNPGEALVFKTNDSDPSAPHCVPHSAFDNPLCPTDTHPRSSIELRAIAYWYG
ncbi:MAG TPA: CmcJ/NvfI family oxidoreductase [Caulobacteraceae bacterium]